MAKYLVLIYNDEARWVEPSPEVEAGFQGHMAFSAANGPKILGGEALQPTSTATSIRRGDDGSHLVTDGPFVETKEAMGGYYLLDAEDLDEAIALAKQVPAPWGGVEVRPVRVFG
jgi:hypothetical protein